VEESEPRSPPVVEETPEATSGKQEEELQKPEATAPLAVGGESAAKEEQGKAPDEQKQQEEDAAKQLKIDEEDAAKQQKTNEEDAAKQQKTDEEDAAKQQKTDEETDNQGQTANEKNADQNQGQDAEDQKTTNTDGEDPGALDQQLTPNDKKADKDDKHDYDYGDFGKDWYKPNYWKGVVVHDCYCWGDYFKPWHYWNHWDYYCGSCYDWYYYAPWHWDYAYYWDYYCGSCYHYYYVVYTKCYDWCVRYIPFFW
jgi:hypothetical protein